MSNILPVKNDGVDDGLQGGHGQHCKMEQDGRVILDLRTGQPAVFTIEEALRRKAHGDYTDIPADAPDDEPKPKAKAGGKK